MKLFLLTQNSNNDYDTYDSCIVCAENEEDAKLITPSGYDYHEERASSSYYSWADKFEDIKCKEIGQANAELKRGVILASFNAG